MVLSTGSGKSDRWASSAGPLLVRTVWLGSHHHAVLTKDDPLLTKPLRLLTKAGTNAKNKNKKATKKQTSNGKSTEDQSQSATPDSFAETSATTSGTTTPSADSRLSIGEEQPIIVQEKRPYSAHPSRSIGQTSKVSTAQRPKTGAPGIDHNRTRNQSRTKSCLKHQMSCPGYGMMGNAPGEVANIANITDDRHKDPLSNQLSDRVLQWLDLAGRIGSAPACHVNGSQANHQNAPCRGPRKRVASVQLYNIRIRNQTLLESDAPALTNNAPASTELKKSGDSRSRNGSAVLENNELSKSINSLADIVTAVEQQVPSSSPTPSAAQSESSKKHTPVGKNYNKIKSKIPAVLSRSGAYEKAVERQHIERACNAQVARKQLHIFMPSLPGRRTIASGDNESCLSTIPSELS